MISDDRNCDEDWASRCKSRSHIARERGRIFCTEKEDTFTLLTIALTLFFLWEAYSKANCTNLSQTSTQRTQTSPFVALTPCFNQASLTDPQITTSNDAMNKETRTDVVSTERCWACCDISKFEKRTKKAVACSVEHVGRARCVVVSTYVRGRALVMIHRSHSCSRDESSTATDAEDQPRIVEARQLASIFTIDGNAPSASRSWCAHALGGVYTSKRHGPVTLILIMTWPQSICLPWIDADVIFHEARQ